MILIADAGSTKIEWALIGPGNSCLMRLCTRGFNAARSHPDRLAEIIREDAPELIIMACGATHIHFYGAGCLPEHCAGVCDKLLALFDATSATADSDMLAAARALCGDKPGIACILGTGSNSCFYDGQKITTNIPPMGFILGDEGSGACLGKALLGRIFKRRLSDEIIDLFSQRYPEATKTEVIANVYRGDRPGAYLASFAPFLKENIGNPEIESLVCDEFRRFFLMNISSYPEAASHPVNFIGSIAHHFEPQLRSAAKACGYTVGTILPTPMNALIHFHTKQENQSLRQPIGTTRTPSSRL